MKQTKPSVKKSAESRPVYWEQGLREISVTTRFIATFKVALFEITICFEIRQGSSVLTWHNLATIHVISAGQRKALTTL